MKLEKAEKLLYILIIAMIIVAAVIMAAESVAFIGFLLCIGLLAAVVVVYILYTGETLTFSSQEWTVVERSPPLR